VQLQSTFHKKLNVVGAVVLVMLGTAGWMLSPALDVSDAATAPTNVTVTDATAVGGTQATLNGTLNPNGDATNYQFEYGTTTSYGTVTPQQSAGSGSAVVNVSQAITGLRSGTVYHVALIATDTVTGQTTTSGDGTFTTASAPTVRTPTAIGVSSKTATLDGNVNPNGSNVTDCHFEFGTTQQYGNSASCAQTVGGGTTDVPVSSDLTGLLPGTVYDFRLVATNGVDTSDSLNQTFTTPADAPTVTAGQATSSTTSSGTGATLNGSINPGGASTTYHFNYGPTANDYTSSTPDVTIPAGTTDVPVSAQLTGQQPGGTIHWQLVADNVQGTIATGDQSLTLAAAPPSLSRVLGAASSDTTAMLSGSVDPNGAATSYQFDYGTTTNYGNSTTAGQIPAGPNAVNETATLTGLKPHTTYHFRLEATNTATGTSVTTFSQDHTFTTDATLPSVQTTAVTKITSAGATLNGTLNPGGADTTYFFEYGLNTNYDQSTAEQDAGSGNTDTGVSAAVTGLQPGATYHYRVVAINSGGASFGQDQTFTVDAAPPSLSGTGGDATGATTASLHGFVNPNGADTSYRFDYGTTTNYGSSTTATDIGSGITALREDASLVGLAPGTTYHYRLEGTNTVKGVTDTTFGQDHEFTTAAAQPTLTQPAATSVTATGLTLGGTVNPNGADTAYHFEYGSSAGNYTNSTSEMDAGSGTAGTNVSADLTGQQPGATIHWRLVAENSQGKSVTDDQSVTLLSAAPSAVTGAGVASSDSAASLHGSVNPNGADTTYRFDYGLTTNYGDNTQSTDIGSGINALDENGSISGLAPDTTYHFRIEATNTANGNTVTTFGDDHTFTTLPAPAAIESSDADSITSTGATLTGTINPNGDTTSYSFEYGLTASYGQDTPAQTIGSGNTSTDVSADISGLQPGATYHYRLVTDNAGGESFGPDRTFTAATAAPEVRTADAVDVTSTTATLHASINPNGADTDFGFDWGTSADYGQSTTDESIAAGTQPVTASAKLTGLTPGTTYHFRISADNGTGSRQLGQDVTFTTPAASPVVDTLGSNGITSNSATLTGSVDPNGADASYYFEYGTTTDYGQRTPEQDAGSDTSSVSAEAALFDLAPGTTYYYRLVSTNSAGTTRGADMTFVTAPGAPDATTGSAWGVRSDSALLSGTISAHGAVTTYRFEYGTTRAYGLSTATETTPLGASDSQGEIKATGLKPGTLYHYRVIATNSVGTTTGDDGVFMTPAASPTIVGDPATHITDHSASVAGSLNSEGAQTRWWFEYGTTRNYGRQTAHQIARSGGGKNVRVHALLGTLQPGTVYHFRLVTANGRGFAYGHDEMVKTLRAKSGLGMRSLDAMPSRRGCKTQYLALDDVVHGHVTAARRPLLRDSQCRTGDIVVSGRVSKLADGSHVKAVFSGFAHRVVSASVKQGTWTVAATLPGLFASHHWTMVVRFAGSTHLLPSSVTHQFMLATMGSGASGR